MKRHLTVSGVEGDGNGAPCLLLLSSAVRQMLSLWFLYRCDPRSSQPQPMASDGDATHCKVIREERGSPFKLPPQVLVQSGFCVSLREVQQDWGQAQTVVGMVLQAYSLERKSKRSKSLFSSFVRLGSGPTRLCQPGCKTVPVLGNTPGGVFPCRPQRVKGCRSSRVAAQLEHARYWTYQPHCGNAVPQVTGGSASGIVGMLGPRVRLTSGHPSQGDQTKDWRAF